MHAGMAELVREDRRKYGHQARNWRSKKGRGKKLIKWDGPPGLSGGETTEIKNDGSGTCTLLQLKDKTCRWPYEGGLFCGAPSVPERPYCLKHCKRAYHDFHPGRGRKTGL